MSGYLVKIGSVVCVRGSRKQSTVALSTCEFDCYALKLAAQETMWVTRVRSEAGLSAQDSVPILPCNQSAINCAAGERCPSDRVKHIEVKFHFILELVLKLNISIKYVPSEENDAEMLTKPLVPTCLQKVLQRIYPGRTLEDD